MVCLSQVGGGQFSSVPVFDQIKLAKAAELTAVKNLAAKTLASAKTNLKALLDTTPALSEEVIAAENSANLTALDSQWECIDVH